MKHILKFIIFCLKHVYTVKQMLQILFLNETLLHYIGKNLMDFNTTL